eukprot:Seg668.2 transcript_id=Seg668.2/GoldUCD/mRNA.D3Y31 product="F-box only protein 32" protein_id=Seg668.2/GoldUCD/D3Y31
MPYIGQDGVSPGEVWLKTSCGWRTCRTIMISNDDMDSSQNHNQQSTTSKIDKESNDDKAQGFQWQTKAPYVVLPGYPNRGPLFYFVSKRGSKENDKYSTVGEAFQALQFRRATRDSRKFLYVCRLLEVLIKNDHITPACGTARKQLYLTLEEIVLTTLDTECNLHLAKYLVNLARDHLMREKHMYYGMPASFDKRLQELADLQGKLKRFKIKKLRKGITKASMNITDLPEDCLRTILKCFSDHQDICNLSRINRHFHKICNDQAVWRGLCRFHFSSTQLERATVDLYPNWKNFYKRLIRRSAMREVFADILQLCSHCHCMFWKWSSHPCTYDPTNIDHKPPVCIPITPKGFLHLFET